MRNHIPVLKDRFRLHGNNHMVEENPYEHNLRSKGEGACVHQIKCT